MSETETLTLTAQNYPQLLRLARIEGTLVVTIPVALPALVQVTGDVIVEAGAVLDAPALEDVGGAFITRGVSRADRLHSVSHNCYIYKGGDLRACNLAKVGGGLFLYPDTQCLTPRVKWVGGGVSINSPVEMPELSHVQGGLVVHAPASLPELVEVGDYVYAFVKCRLPALLNVVGDLVVHPGAHMTAERLTTVGARLVIQAPCHIPSVSHVGGDLFATVEAALPALTQVGGSINISPDVRVEMPRYRHEMAEEPPAPMQRVVPARTRVNAPEAGWWAGRKWAALGSSVTIFGAYTHPLSEMLGVSLTNLSVGGGALSTSATSAPGEVHAQIAKIPLDADLVTFEVGMVDFRTNARLGALYDTTLDTFYGALYRAIMDTLAAQPRRTLVFLTPLGISSPDFDAAWDVPNQNGNRFEEFAQAILEVCRWCGVAVADCGREAGIGGPTLALYTADGIHLNQAGGLRLAHYLYRQLQLLPPFPALPGGPDAGPGVWSLQPVEAATHIRGTGVSLVGAPDRPDGIGALQQAEGYYFSALWLSADTENAIEFVSLPTSGNSLWLVLGCGEKGWTGVGDFGNFGAQRLATFEQGHGSVSFGPFLTASYSIEPNESGMRWRIQRCGPIVQIYQQRVSDGNWVEACHPIHLDEQGFDAGYFLTSRLGILATHGTICQLMSGSYVHAKA